MTISEAQQLQRQLTDKYVLVRDGVPELRRFRGLTGTVKTVNMNGRALVQFDGPVDIGWYDIDPAYLQVIDQPLPKQALAEHAAKPAAKTAEASAPAKAAPAGKSPLDLIRQQAATKAPAAGVEGGSGRPSPLDLIRQQAQTKSPPTAEAEPSPASQTASAGEPAPAAAASPPATAPAGTTGLSPLEIIRRQGAAKR
jgi:hypothetical protein